MTDPPPARSPRSPPKSRGSCDEQPYCQTRIRRPSGRRRHVVRTREALPSRESQASLCTVRLTIDVTPEQRGRIKITAFQRGQTVADLLRDLLAREFPDKDGDPQ